MTMMNVVPYRPGKWLYVFDTNSIVIIFKDKDYYDDDNNIIVRFLKYKKLYPIPGRIIFAAKWFGSGISVDADQDDLTHFENGYYSVEDDDPECDNVHYRLVLKSGHNQYAFIFFDAINDNVKGIGGVLYVKNI